MNPSNQAQAAKDIVYVDIDDEITSIIDKVSGSSQKIVALVLPKRATVFQSIVNMKLLKRSADSMGKSVVLITTEHNLLPLAGAVGLYVARNLQSRPEIPPPTPVASSSDAGDDLSIDEDKPVEYTAANAAAVPVGELAKKSDTFPTPPSTTPEAIETVTLDDEPAVADAAPAVAGKTKKVKPDRSKKVPSFSRFQKLLALGVIALIALIGLGYVAAVVMPKATIAIATDATDYNSEFTFTLDTTIDNVDADELALPATAVQQQKTDNVQVAATGQQNNGQKATGSVKITNCSEDTVSIPAGTGFSAGSHTYISQTSVVVSTSNYQFKNGAFTCKNDGNATVNVVAQRPGTEYNVSSTSMTFSGNPSPSTVTATGSDMSGGTDDIRKVVSASDIENAKAKLTSESTDEIKEALAQQLRQQNLYPLKNTFTGGTPNVSTSNDVGDSADTVTVTQTTTYTMYGTKREYIKQLIEKDIQQQIDPTTQMILNDGLDSASFTVNNTTDTTSEVALETTATVGPKLDADNIKDIVKGKQSGYVKSEIGNQPGVTNVTVTLSPFWVTKVPSNPEKITVSIDKTTGANE